MGVACSKHDATDQGSTNPHQQHHHPYSDQLASSSSSQPNNGGVWSSCMGSCSGMDPAVDPRMDSCRADAIDPVMYDLCRKSLNMTLQDEETKLKEQQESAPPAPSGSSQSSSHKQKQQRHQQQNQQQRHHVGQYHLLYKNQTKSSAASSPSLPQSQAAQDAAENSLEDISTVPNTSAYSTRLIVRRRPIGAAEEGTHGTHLYAIRYPPDDVAPTNKMMAGTPAESSRLQEQAPFKQRERKKRGADNNNTVEPVPEPPRPSPTTALPPLPTEGLTDFFQPARMKQTKPARQTIQEWVTVSEEHCIYVVDVGLTPAQCDKIVQVTEQVCRGQYAAYTYAKQTLGCREFPVLAQACAPPVQSVVQAILGLPTSNSSKAARNAGKDGAQQHLQLDDREPHLVKYDVTKKERQKLDMHTDKSEWTFLIALSNGCGLDYDGGGTYFECLNATIHVQRGHALIFPGKLRHCGQRITRGLRYLLVGFLVDKAHMVTNNTTTAAGGTSNNTAAGSTTNNTTTTTNAAGSAAKATAGAGTTGDKTNDDDNEKDKSNNSSSSLSSTGTGTKPVSCKSLTGIPTTIASA